MLVEAMQERGVVVDVFTLNSVLKACRAAGQVECEPYCFAVLVLVFVFTFVFSLSFVFFPLLFGFFFFLHFLPPFFVWLCFFGMVYACLFFSFFLYTLVVFALLLFCILDVCAFLFLPCFCCGHRICEYDQAFLASGSTLVLRLWSLCTLPNPPAGDVTYF